MLTACSKINTSFRALTKLTCKHQEEIGIKVNRKLAKCPPFLLRKCSFCS